MCSMEGCDLGLRSVGKYSEGFSALSQMADPVPVAQELVRQHTWSALANEIALAFSVCVFFAHFFGVF